MITAVRVQSHTGAGDECDMPKPIDSRLSLNTQRMPPQDVVGQDRAAADLSDEKILKNKPKASKLRQQQLPAWQPILTASTVIPTVIGVGVIFIPIGIALFLASESGTFEFHFSSVKLG
ncbi:hypothetical protein ANCDUO_10174 [Ancylostoma duodenale]|uniref:Uncharacterized protein n=1 Tax=Ancylostoma duodenale TaxID=51022 RepID=A0A0C2DB13_9BILA|nr:hypothetical protein ANCDUO_10174 [Ancylostoma duodenale]